VGVAVQKLLFLNPRQGKKQTKDVLNMIWYMWGMQKK